MYVLSDLWWGNIAPCDRALPKSSAYKEVLKQLGESADAVYEALSDTGKEHFDAYFFKECELASMTECDTFVYGFRLGARMILDVVGEFGPPMGKDR